MPILQKALFELEMLTDNVGTMTEIEPPRAVFLMTR